MVMLKPGHPKEGFEFNTPYHLVVEDATAFPSGDRRVNLFKNKNATSYIDMNLYQDYYPRDGNKFHDEFEIVEDLAKKGGNRKTRRNRSARRKRNNRKKSNRR